MKTSNIFRLILYSPFLLLLGWNQGLTAAEIQLPSEAKYFLQQAEDYARKGSVVNALKSFDEYLNMLTIRDGRDSVQNSYRWIPQAEITRARNEQKPVDWDALTTELDPLVKEADESKNPIRQWRIHLLMADMAFQQANREKGLQEIDAAIAAYPDLFYPDPARQSSIQYLLNFGAMVRAQEDVPGAIEWFLEAFKKNPVCVYVELEPWESFFKKQGNPGRFVDFYGQVILAFQQKLDNAEMAAKHDSLRYFMRLFQSGLEQVKGRSGGV
jgi:tetratricopeptide (TPR) repeat protein